MNLAMPFKVWITNELHIFFFIIKMVFHIVEKICKQSFNFISMNGFIKYMFNFGCKFKQLFVLVVYSAIMNAIDFIPFWKQALSLISLLMCDKEVIEV